MKVIVVGAGIMGLATAWASTRRGHHVTLVEQGGTIPGPLAASGDQHRMIRRAYGTSDGYARMISEAFDAWDELWRDLGANHFVQAGILCICQREGDEADVFRAGFDTAGTPYTLLNPGEAAARRPFLDPATFRYAFETTEGGVLLCLPIARDLSRWLGAHGARVLTGARVTGIDPAAGAIDLAGGDRLQADAIVMAAGAWTPGLLPELAGELTIHRTAVVYLDPPAELAAAWADAPAVLSIGGDTEGYVLPPVSGTGLKFAAGFMRRPATDPEADRVGSRAEGERLLHSFAPPFARIGDYRIRDVVTCAYAYTADRSFLGRRIGRVWAISACSGHGYKFGAAIGRRVAQAVEDQDEAGLARWLRAEHLVAA